MKKVFNIIYKCHKWFAIPLALMFIMWYCSGIVMMYHSFPRLRPGDRPFQSVDSVALSTLWKQLPDSIGSCKIMFSGNHLLMTSGSDTYGGYRPGIADLKAIAESFGTGIQRVDTLNNVDKWTPFSNLIGHLPLYKIVGKDDTFIYVSSQTGEIVQRSTLSERRWASVGALLHYVYITPLRLDVGLWRTVVIWMSGLSTISVIFGLVIAIRFLVKRHKMRVFKKRSWQWHYSFGLVFGIFMLAFIFSGMMSLADIPDWIMKSRELKEMPSYKIAKEGISLSELPSKFGQASLITTPQYIWNVNTGKKVETYSASQDKKLDFSPSFMTTIIERQTGEKVSAVTHIKNDFFYHRGGVEGWRADTEHFSVYWNEQGYYRILDAKEKAHYVCYRLLHTMKIPGLYDIKWLHSLYMWIILLGGLVIVVTGTILSVRAVIKKLT